MKISVMAATGQLGRKVIQALLDQGAAPGDVIAGARTPEKAADLVAQGITVRRTNYEDRDAMQAQHDLLRKTASLVDEGVLQTTLTEHFGPLTAENLRKAPARIETGRMIGKLVLGGIG